MQMITFAFYYFIKLKVVAQTERLITVERKIDKLADQETQNRLGGEMHILKENQSSIETRVTQLERAGPVGGQNGWSSYYGFYITVVIKTPLKKKYNKCYLSYQK